MGDNIKRRRFLRAAGVTGTIGLAGCMGGGGGGNGSGGGNTSGGGGDWTPRQNLTVIVPWGAGGGTDVMTRGVMNPAESILSERGVNISINVENITGANGLNAARRVLAQPANGYTLLASTNVLGPTIARGIANFTLEDWAAIARVQHDTSWIYTSGRDGQGYDSIGAMVQAANQGGIQLGAVGGVTGAAFLVLWAQAAGILDQTQIVSYNDAGRMRTDVISGEIDGAYGEIQELQEQYQAGDIRLLLVGTGQQLDEFPDVTAAGEKGWDVTYGVSRGFVAKSGTPQAAIDYWMNLVKEAMQSDSYQQLEQDTLLYLREGYQPADAYADTIEQTLQTYERALELYNPSS